jgi:hypothetical protein
MHLSRVHDIDDASAKVSVRELLAEAGPVNACTRRRVLHIAARFLLDYFFH